MKPKILKFSLLILLVGLLYVSCHISDNDTPNIENQEELINPNDTIVVSNHPGVSVFKTNEDYINCVWVVVLSDGQLSSVPAYSLADTIGRLKIAENGDIISNVRWRLENGYIVSMEIDLEASFTDITIDEYVKYNTQQGVTCWPNPLIKSRIVDSNPFTEFYHMGCNGCKLKQFTLGQITEMINNGTLEDHFDKLK